MIKVKKHPIECFWKNAYRKFQKESGVFNVPYMHDPILSPRFGKKDGEYFNLIQRRDSEILSIPGYSIRNNFYLCVLKTKEVCNGNKKFLIKDLKTARNDPFFWTLLKNGFVKDYYFLDSLVKFLPTLEAEFKVGYLFEKEIPYGLVIIGFTNSEAVLLSGMIKDTHRDKKKSRDLNELINYIAYSEGIKEYFFWTMSEKLTRYANQIDRYLIYAKNKKGD